MGEVLCSSMLLSLYNALVRTQETMTDRLDAMVMSNEGANAALPVYHGERLLTCQQFLS